MPAASRLAVLITLLITGLLITSTLPAVNHASQKKDRIIRKGDFPQEPVRITLVKVKKGRSSRTRNLPTATTSGSRVSRYASKTLRVSLLTT